MKVRAIALLGWYSGFGDAEAGKRTNVYGINLREIAQRRGPFVSLCIDASHNTEDAEDQRKLRWRSIREQLVAQDAPETALELLDEAIAEKRPSRGRTGRVLIADPGSVLVDHLLAEPPAREIVRVSPLPYLLPLIEQQSHEVPHVIAVVDRIGCDLYGIDEDENLIEEVTEGAGHPVHKVHHGGGWAHRSMHRRVEETVRRNVEEVATAVRNLADRINAQIIVLVGEVGARAALSKVLESPTARIVEVEAGARAAGSDSAALEAQVEEAVRAQAWQRQHQAVEQLTAARGKADGLAVEGVPETARALLAANADTLLIDAETIGDRPVELDPELLRGISGADWINENAAKPGVYRADEALPVVTLLQGGSIVPVEGAVVPEQGVATLLRHR
ncbi:Vms1/Ankzf1 family peptidyl-tRNA hydrolase [Nocardia sp. NPDC050630]|uniref:Rv2629 family ribosome hibernation factor n=1 Tax=Nocardia sp. NPDC050630 TaxID=3364321 RepID=UPI003797E2BE